MVNLEVGRVDMNLLVDVKSEILGGGLRAKDMEERREKKKERGRKQSSSIERARARALRPLWRDDASLFSCRKYATGCRKS